MLKFLKGKDNVQQSFDQGDVSGQQAGVVDYENKTLEAEENEKIREYVNRLQEQIPLTSAQRDFAHELMLELYYDGKRH